MSERLLFRAISCSLLLVLTAAAGLAAGEASRTTTATAEKPRSTAELIADLQRLATSGKLSIEELRTVQESLAGLRLAQQLRDRREQRREAEETLRRLLCGAADADAADRAANLSAAQYMLFLGEPEAALKYLGRARPASAEDMEWPFLCARAYLQLGDFTKAAIASARVDSLMQGRSQLNLSKPVAVDQVTGYRMYTPSSTTRYSAGDMLTLYVEISGAKFSPAAGGSRCCLDFSLEVRDELQNVIDSNDNYGRFEPGYNGPVRDLHATLYYRLPDRVDPGRYVLMLRCRDAIGEGATAQTEFTFTVGNVDRLKIPDNSAEAAKARAAVLMQQAKSGDIKEMQKAMKALTDPDADLLEGVDKAGQTPGKDSGQGKSDAQKQGEELRNQLYKSTGEAVNK